MVVGVTASIVRLPSPMPSGNSSDKPPELAEKRRSPRLFGGVSNASRSILLNAASLLIDCRVCGCRFARVSSVRSSSISRSVRISLSCLSRPSACSLRKALELLIDGRIGQARFLKTLQPQPTAVATAAGPSLLVRIIAAQRQPVIDTQAHPRRNDLRLGQPQERRMYAERPPPFHRRLRRNVGQAFKLCEEFRPAIRIAGV